MSRPPCRGPQPRRRPRDAGQDHPGHRRGKSRVLPTATIDPDGFYGSFVGCTPDQGYGLLGDQADAELPNPGKATFATYLTEVAHAWCEGRGFGDANAPRVIDGHLD
ncbi:hypothetical protein [Streptomyces hirsutus]|uniref:hypothetical protein n=1 Tax=Streptomyces hirsutus TaxID=35620 RepID=UPI00367E1685